MDLDYCSIYPLTASLIKDAVTHEISWDKLCLYDYCAILHRFLTECDEDSYLDLMAQSTVKQNIFDLISDYPPYCPESMLTSLHNSITAETVKKFKPTFLKMFDKLKEEYLTELGASRPEWTERGYDERQ